MIIVQNSIVYDIYKIYSHTSYTLYSWLSVRIDPMWIHVSRHANTHTHKYTNANTHTEVQWGYVGDEPVAAAAGPRVHPAQTSQGQKSPSKSNNSKTRLWETAMCVRLCVWKRTKEIHLDGGKKCVWACMSTFVYLCCLCICATGKLEWVSSFQFETSADRVAFRDYE